MHRPRRNSNTPDQAAARIFEARLKRHVQENPDCQWELDWFRRALKRSVRRSRVLIDQEIRKLAELGWPLCNEFMEELAKPHSHLDEDEAQSPESDSFESHLPDEHDERALEGDESPEGDLLLDAWPPARDASPERGTSFDSVTTLGSIFETGVHQPASSSQPMIPQIQLTAPQPSSETDGYPVVSETGDRPIAGGSSVMRGVESQVPLANSVSGGNQVIRAGGNLITPGPGSPPAAQGTVHRPEPASSGSKSKPLPGVEPEQPVLKVNRAPSTSRRRIESRGTPAQQPEPRLDKVPHETQPTDEPLPSSKRTPVPSRTSRTKTQRELKH
ncbi:hypothetical protein FRC10_000253 [Ceratobasidium sp. 414]|nr:hypothetical protein FRC10_000253 [Ceratobasidium sp. 414]